MDAREDAVLFEARSAPLHALSENGVLWVAGLLLAGFTFTGLVFTLMGAWPVLAFAGIEGIGVVALLFLYRRHARTSGEVIRLTERELLVRRREGGRVFEASFEPFWARLEKREEAGRLPRLFLVHRSREAEVGCYLAAEERDSLEAALRDALRRYREPAWLRAAE
ncbi:MAG: DUF2244 domain-containing protein [Acetobacteraceae bacterium]|nr:DUF2244 domain-containing protein [Acetobacteraceae bacterium]